MTSKVQVVNCTGKPLYVHVERANVLGLDLEIDSRITPEDVQGDAKTIRDKVREVCQAIGASSFVALPTDSAFVSDLLASFLLPKGCTLLYLVVHRATGELQGVSETPVSQWWHSQGAMCLLRWGDKGAEIDVYRWGEPGMSPKSVKGLSDFTVDVIEELAKQHRMRNRIRMDDVRLAMLTGKMAESIVGGVMVATVIGDSDRADELFDMVDIARENGWFAKDLRKSLARDSVTILIVSPEATWDRFVEAVGLVVEDCDDGTHKPCRVEECGDGVWEIVTEHPGAWIGFGGSGIKRLRSVLGKNIRVKVK